MLEMTINEKGCRGCQFCLEVCPTECFSFDVNTGKAKVAALENCIGCLSCAFICPSGAISHKNHHEVKNFYRNIEFSKRMEKFL
ncbi:MAG: 4Fe-4S dicluster domain-containing protein [Desulforhopalus sp.]|nr:4Fe-4S dicluster domain-containing protein [Desulforhopalus sp.]